MEIIVNVQTTYNHYCSDYIRYVGAVGCLHFHIHRENSLDYTESVCLFNAYYY